MVRRSIGRPSHLTLRRKRLLSGPEEKSLPTPPMAAQGRMEARARVGLRRRMKGRRRGRRGRWRRYLPAATLRLLGHISAWVGTSLSQAGNTPWPYRWKPEPDGTIFPVPDAGNRWKRPESATPSLHLVQEEEEQEQIKEQKIKRGIRRRCKSRSKRNI